MKRLGIVTGLTKEATIARRAVSPDGAPAPIIHCAGPGPDRAGRAARALLAEGADALLSFGVAGGLDPNQRPGTVVVAERVIVPDGSALDCDAKWRDQVLSSQLAEVTMVSASIASSVQPLRLAVDKTALFETTNAAAVDMESFVVARVAHKTGIPFLALRAIADPASRAVPEAALRALSTDGRILPFAALAVLVMSPADLVTLALLARDGRTAFAALRRVALLVPGFGLV